MKHNKAPLFKNQRLELDIVAAGSGGEGIGRHEGFAVFVPAAAVGDRIEAHIVKVQRSMAYARIARIIEPSADRIPADCEAFPRCGGCVYRHITYQAECALKRQRVTDALRRIGGLELEAEEILPSAQSDHYRNKAQLPCQKTEQGIGFGFYAQRSHRIVECADCLLQPEGFSAIAAATAQYMERAGVEPYNEVSHSGLVRHLYIRASRHSSEIMVCLVVNGDRLPEEKLLADLICTAEPRVSGVLININKKRTNVILGERCRIIRGSEHITERLLGVDFRISPLSFFQVNPEQAERLYAKAAQYAELSGSETVLDMYCGGGAIGLTMARSAGRIIGVEVIADAVKDARENARLNGITNAEYICADAAQAAEQLAHRGIKPNVVILDPPRKGCEEALLRTVSGMEPQRIVYVSCDPATLARDLKLLEGMGYHAERATAVDMFPRTVHVECVVLLTKSHN